MPHSPVNAGDPQADDAFNQTDAVWRTYTAPERQPDSWRNEQSQTDETERAQSQIHTLFDTFVANPAPMPDRFKKRIEIVGLRRSVGDYIAGMTDRFFEQQYLAFVG